MDKKLTLETLMDNVVPKLCDVCRNRGEYIGEDGARKFARECGVDCAIYKGSDDFDKVTVFLYFAKFTVINEKILDEATWDMEFNNAYYDAFERRVMDKLGDAETSVVFIRD